MNLSNAQALALNVDFPCIRGGRSYNPLPRLPHRGKKALKQAWKQMFLPIPAQEVLGEGTAVGARTKFGVEFTYLPNKEVPESMRWTATPQEHGSEVYTGMFRMRELCKGRKFHDVGMDPGVVEIPTLPKARSGVVRDYKFLGRAAKEANLVTRLNWTTGGNGHVHIDTGALGSGAGVLGIAWLAMRTPFCWAFDHPYRYTGTRFPLFGTYESGPAINCNHGTYNFVTVSTNYSASVRLNNDNRSLEFRFFDMPQTTKQLNEHLAVAEALHRKFVLDAHRTYEGLKDLTKHKVLTYKENLINMTEDQALEVFYRTLEELELPARKYGKYEMNILSRFAAQRAWGKQHTYLY